jgi:hypothetical protein
MISHLMRLSLERDLLLRRLSSRSLLRDLHSSSTA